VIAIDTNVLVRFLVDDDKTQAGIAEALIRANEIFLSRTVLLETEWVLRSVYRIDASVLADLFDSYSIPRTW
jgi:predicted nucleic-acid-binding protein